MKLISWNVNGIRSCRQKGFDGFFKAQDADIFCMQEVKAFENQSGLDAKGYYMYWHAANRAGYSGTATLTKEKPMSVRYDMEGHTGEGRILTLEFPEFYMVNTYVPNSKDELLRLPYRMEWQDAFKAFLKGLDLHKHVVICGDLNVAHQEIDIKNARTNRRNAGFTDEEREKMTDLLQAGFIDTYRFLNPDKRDAYTWWSYMGNARTRNVGWRIDYFLMSERMATKLADAMIFPEVFGSDHCPVGIELR